MSKYFYFVYMCVHFFKTDSSNTHIKLFKICIGQSRDTFLICYTIFKWKMEAFFSVLSSKPCLLKSMFKNMTTISLIPPQTGVYLKEVVGFMINKKKSLYLHTVYFSKVHKPIF